MEKANKTIDNNFYQHSWQITSQVAGMQVFFTDGMSIADCGLSCDTFNIIYIRNSQKLTAEEMLKAKTYFEKKNFAYTIWAEESELSAAAKQLLKEAGLKVTNQEPGMILPLHSFAPVSRDAFHYIKKVTTPEQVTHYAEVVAHNWQPPDKNIMAYYAKATPVILKSDSPASLYVYYLSDIPVAAIELFISSNHTAGIFSLSTLEKYRGQGIGSALFTYVLNEAKKQGCSHAVLQASEDGIGIYKRLGFTIETHFYEWHNEGF